MWGCENVCKDNNTLVTHTFIYCICVWDGINGWHVYCYTLDSDVEVRVGMSETNSIYPLCAITISRTKWQGWYPDIRVVFVAHHFHWILQTVVHSQLYLFQRS